MFKINNNYYILIHHLLYSIEDKYIILVYFISILYFRIFMHNIKYLTYFKSNILLGPILCL